MQRTLLLPLLDFFLDFLLFFPFLSCLRDLDFLLLDFDLRRCLSFRLPDFREEWRRLPRPELESESADESESESELLESLSLSSLELEEASESELGDRDRRPRPLRPR